MSVEALEKVIQLWERGDITPEQAIGKILLHLSEHHRKLLKLIAAVSRLESAARQRRPFG